MILRTFFFQLICLRNNRFDRYFLKVLVGICAYRILFFGLLGECLRVMSRGDWSIFIFTVFNILIKVADFVKELHLFVHVLAFHTELIQEIEVWRKLFVGQGLHLLNLSYLNFLAELICQENLMEVVCAD